MKDSLYFEKKTLSAMISIYCESVHGEKTLCDECRKLQEYAIQRIDRCPFGPGKPACKKCPVHCYSPGRREEIKTVMRFSGPAMIYKHPVLAILHLVKEKKQHRNQKNYHPNKKKMGKSIFESGNKFRFNESVDYSTDGIVSKRVLDRTVGNVTLFAFDKGQRLSEHSAPFDAMVQVVEGTGEVIINKVPHQLGSGETIIMPANIPHAVNAIEKFKMVLTMIKG